jgi:alpha-N-arabinofuranosidase
VPSFVGRKQAHAHAEASTSMRFTPAADGERAGLAAVQSDQSWLFFGIQQIGGSPMLVLVGRDGEQAPRVGRVLASRKLPGTLAQPVRLKLAFDAGRVSATYALNNGTWKSLGKDLDASFLSTKKAGGFVGTVIGLYNSVQP